MAVRELIVERVETFEAGTPFGATGPYEVVTARAVIDLDRDAPANSRIADIDAPSLEPTVEIVSDVVVLRPVSAGLGNGCLLAVVPNRGTTGGIPFTFAERAVGVDIPLDSGDGWLLRGGWTVAWPGWQCDLEPDAGLLGCSVPDLVDEQGDPLAGPVRVQLQPLGGPAPHLALRSTADFTGALMTYPAADVQDPDAMLTVSRTRSTPGTTIPRSEWGFGRLEQGEIVHDPKSVWLAGGFRPDRVYDVIYRSDRCPLAGAGLAAWRDVVSHLRHDEDRGIGHAIAVGWSQSGRFLRQVLKDGMHVDERGRSAVDAVVPFIAGASRGEFNQRRGQPSEALASGLGHLPPFGLDDLLGWSGVADLPKVITVNSASEYWRADGSLGHISTDGLTDLDDPPGIRTYSLAGVDHLGGTSLPFELPGGPRNFVDPTPISRAILELTRAWVVDGIEPPPSRVPRVSDGTAVERRVVLDRFEVLPTVPVPTEAQLAQRHSLAAGPDADRGIARLPIGIGEPFAALVSDVDDDGNEIAGIRHPEVSVPVASHTGWNVLLAEGTRWEALAVLAGNSHPLPGRAGTNDPRTPIESRYTSRDDYLARVRAAAEDLVTQRFLLPHDIDVVVDTAARHHDAALDPSEH